MNEFYRSKHGYDAVQKRYHEYLLSWPIPSDQCMLKTSLGNTFVLSCGPSSAPPLLLLHGAMGNAVAWLADALVWAQHYRVHIVDVVGESGWSAAVRPAFTGTTYSAWLLEVMAALGLQRVAIVGESLGGWLALDLATTQPERVSQLVLLCPAGIGMPHNFLAKVWPLLLLGGWGRRKIGELALGKMPNVLTPQAQKWAEFFALIQQHFKPRHGEFPRFSHEQLARLTMPVLLIAGAKDVLFDSAETVRRLQQACPHAGVELRPGAGHLLLERTQPILHFLRQH
jgi:pimeloyl-ACP methyl ester carboxylesterase